MRRRFVLAGFAAAALSTAGNAAPAPSKGEHDITYTFAATGETMHYELFVPSGYDGSKPLPVVVVLHGSGVDTLGIFAKTGLDRIAEARGYILIAPRGYELFGGYGGIYPVVVTHATAEAGRDIRAHSAAVHRSPPPPPTHAVAADDYVEQRPGEFRTAQISALSEAETLAAIADAGARVKLDPHHTYLMGNSMGGVGAAYFAVRYPTMWAAVAPSGGPVAVWSYPFSRLRDGHVSALFVHGEFDEHCSPHWSQVLAEAGAKDGADTHFLEVPGGSHGRGWEKVLPQTFDFFAAHAR